MILGLVAPENSLVGRAVPGPVSLEKWGPGQTSLGRMVLCEPGWWRVGSSVAAPAWPDPGREALAKDTQAGAVVLLSVTRGREYTGLNIKINTKSQQSQNTYDIFSVVGLVYLNSKRKEMVCLSLKDQCKYYFYSEPKMIWRLKKEYNFI